MIECSSRRDRYPAMGADPIRIELSSAAGRHQPLGQPLNLSVRVINVADHPIWMVGVLPGSEGLRYPHYIVDIQRPSGRAQTRLPEALDYVRGLRIKDFVQLAPGESFDPQGKGFIPIQQLALFKPVEPGNYCLRLCFDATARDPHSWLGHTPIRDQEQVEALIDRVPPVQVWSNTLQIEFD